MLCLYIRRSCVFKIQLLCNKEGSNYAVILERYACYNKKMFGLTATDIAKHLDVSRSTITRRLNGEPGSPDHMEKYYEMFFDPFASGSVAYSYGLIERELMSMLQDAIVQCGLYNAMSDMWIANLDDYKNGQYKEFVTKMLARTRPNPEKDIDDGVDFDDDFDFQVCKLKQAVTRFKHALDFVSEQKDDTFIELVQQALGITLSQEMVNRVSDTEKMRTFVMEFEKTVRMGKKLNNLRFELMDFVNCLVNLLPKWKAISVEFSQTTTQISDFFLTTFEEIESALRYYFSFRRQHLGPVDIK